MDIKKCILGTVVVFVVLAGMGFVIHEMLLAADYQAVQAEHNTFREQEQAQSKMWIHFVGLFFFSSMFVYVYSKGVENKPWLQQGICYAAIVWVMVSAPAAMYQNVFYRVPASLAMKWMAASAVEMLVAGLVVAFIYKKQ
ncbi:MAG TPA: hypothetical protein VGA40_02230 [Candidatus Acidoferrales bacterium]